jgi:hypothetical protein
MAYLQYSIITDLVYSGVVDWSFWEGVYYIGRIYLIPTVSMVVLFVLLGAKNNSILSIVGTVVTILLPAIATVVVAVEYISNTGQFFLGLFLLILFGVAYIVIGLFLTGCIALIWLGPVHYLANNNSSNNSADTSDAPHISINSTTGILYRGTGWTKEEIGSYENGVIYRGTGWTREEIGSYENSIIYRGNGWTREEIGSYENGIIYRGTGWSREGLGSYEKGIIYRGTGWTKEEIGSYNAGEVGAAAASFILLFLE